MSFINAKEMLELTKSKEELKKETIQKHVISLLNNCLNSAKYGHRTYSSLISLNESGDVIKQLENLGYKVSILERNRICILLKIEW